jgi:hypothetical protein
MNEQLDDIREFEAKETAHKLPAGWLLLFWGLILWGVYYLWTYSPALGGWSQAKEYAEVAGGSANPASSGLNIFATILFTAIPTTVAIVLMVANARRKRAGQ